MHSVRYWLFAATLALAGPALAAVGATAGAPLEGLRFHFAPLDGPVRSVAEGEAFVDFGTVTANPGKDRRRGIVVRQRVAVRLDGGTGGAGSARVSVALATETPGCAVRLNGMPLSTIPRVIDPVHRVGAAVVHEIEVSIPANVPAGAFLSNLRWFAERD